jgi:2'-5' RNA ligase
MSKRLFVAIDVPESIQQVLGNLNPHLRGVRWTEPAQLHLTLGFFGQVVEEVELKFRRAFFLPIVGLGSFPPKGLPKIIWIGVGRGHPHLFQVHKRVQEAALTATLEPELRSWHPHITLARCREINASVVRKFVQSNGEFEAGTVRVTDFHLYSSKLTPAGSIHTRELTIPAKNGFHK